MVHGWLVVWNIFFHILGISSFQLTKSIIFQRGMNQLPTRINIIILLYIYIFASFEFTEHLLSRSEKCTLSLLEKYTVH